MRLRQTVPSTAYMYVDAIMYNVEVGSGANHCVINTNL